MDNGMRKRHDLCARLSLMMMISLCDERVMVSACLEFGLVQIGKSDGTVKGDEKSGYDWKS
jgi:hypothetical protein